MHTPVDHLGPISCIGPSPVLWWLYSPRKYINKIWIWGSQVKILLNLVSCMCGSSFSILLSNSTLKHFVKPIMKLSNTCMYFLIIHMIFKQPEIWLFYVSSRGFFASAVFFTISLEKPISKQQRQHSLFFFFLVSTWKLPVGGRGLGDCCCCFIVLGWSFLELQDRSTLDGEEWMCPAYKETVQQSSFSIAKLTSHWRQDPPYYWPVWDRSQCAVLHELVKFF